MNTMWRVMLWSGGFAVELVWRLSGAFKEKSGKSNDQTISILILP